VLCVCVCVCVRVSEGEWEEEGEGVWVGGGCLRGHTFLNVVCLTGGTVEESHGLLVVLLLVVVGFCCVGVCVWVCVCEIVVQ
jgi:hypothetical protein